VLVRPKTFLKATLLCANIISFKPEDSINSIPGCPLKILNTKDMSYRNIVQSENTTEVTLT